MPAHSRSKNGVASVRLCAGIHVLNPRQSKDVDGRVKPGHDGLCFHLSKSRCLTRSSSIFLAGAVALAAIVFSTQPSYCGELDSERDEDATLAFVGSTRQVGTLAPVSDVVVKAELGNRRIIVRSNNEGVYKLIPNFGTEVKGDSVTISCAKDGYETVDVSRRELSSSKAHELVVAECLMAPKP
jgi:hypothetical protein